MAVVGTMLVIASWLIVTVSSQFPGITKSLYDLKHIFPLSYGYSSILGISYQASTAFALLPCFGSSLGFMFAVGRQVNAMARSHLLPTVLKATYGSDQTPVNAMLFGSIIGMIGLFCAWKYDPYTLLFRMAIQGGCFVYISMFCCYLYFYTKYSHMTRGFRNPLGWVSAALGIPCFLLVIISLLSYQTSYLVAMSYFVTMGGMIIYYYAYVETRQKFSLKEQQIFLRIYSSECKFDIRKARISVIS